MRPRTWLIRPKLIALAACVATALAGCAPALHRPGARLPGSDTKAAPSRFTKEMQSVDTADTTNAPKLSSPEISERVLRLIDTIHDRDGLSPDNIQIHDGGSEIGK